MDISIVIVSWNVSGLLRNCLRSVHAELERNDEFSVETFLIDNSSADDTVDMVRREFPWVQLIVNDRNVGFTRANNQALPLTSGRYILLLNPDTEMLPGLIRTLVTYADSHPTVGVIGPKLLFPTGRVQSSRRRFPRYATAFIESTVLQRYFPRNRLLREYYLADVPDDQLQEVDWVVGACLLVRREAIGREGLFDERYFMYSEELDLCYRLKKAGWKVMYHPEARVVHHEAQSSDQDVLSRNIHFHDSKCKYFGKTQGKVREQILRAFIVGTFVFQLIEESMKYILVARNRDMRRHRLSVLAAAARWHLARLICVSG